MLGSYANVATRFQRACQDKNSRPLRERMSATTALLFALVSTSATRYTSTVSTVS